MGARWGWGGLGLTGVLALVVFWGFDALPFMDLPAHAGLIAMRHRFAEEAFEQRHYVLAPHIGPYSLFRLLGEGFARVLGPVGAVRALATLPVLATPLAVLHARRALHGDRSPTFGFFGVILSFGFMTVMGFASYLLGVAIMLFALTRWLELLGAADEGEDVQRRELWLAALGPLVFVAHGHAFVLFLLCAGVSAICTGRRRARLVRLRALVPGLALAAWDFVLERGSDTPPGSVPVVPPLVPVFGSAEDKLELLFTPTLMTRYGVDLVLALAMWACAVACAVYSLRGNRAATAEARASRALYMSAAVLVVLFVALPRTVGWFGFADGRLLPVILLLSLAGARRQALPRRLVRLIEIAAPAAALAAVSTVLVASSAFQREAAGHREVLARVPAQATLLNLPLDPKSDAFAARPFIHYDKLALADRPVLVSDIWFHQGSAIYPKPGNPVLRLPASYSESDLAFIDWPAYHLEDWDFVLVRTRPNASEPYAPPALTLDTHLGGWWLYRRLR